MPQFCARRKYLWLKVRLYCCCRVLKPPGGGSSDIFGTSEAIQQSPRRAHANHLQSSVFGTNGTTEMTTARRNKPGNDSYSRLFGPIESRPPSTPVNRMKSNLPFGVKEGGSDAQQSHIIQNGQQETSAPTGEICSTVCTQRLKAGLLIRAEFMVCCGTTQTSISLTTDIFPFCFILQRKFLSLNYVIQNYLGIVT